jgi:hypothetical protein
MRAEDALRKIGLLRKVKLENGALEAEAENAARLAKALMERYAITSEDVLDAAPRPAFRMTWVYWQELLHEFGLQLRHFGHRGNAAIGADRIVYINLRTSQWSVEQHFSDFFFATAIGRDAAFPCSAPRNFCRPPRY